MAKSSQSSGLGPIIGLIIASIFSGLILSVWAFISKSRGNTYGLQLFFGLLAIVVFGYFLSFKVLFSFSSTGDQTDVMLYYVGMAGTYINALAAIIWIAALFKKST